jgi:long-subunit fatty acid transport protein
VYAFVFLLLTVPALVSGQAVSDTNFSGVVGSGARAFGMGGAFIAVADDATAASWNPGGLGQLERPEISFVLRGQQYRDMTPANNGLDFSSSLVGFTGPKDRKGSSYGIDFISFTYPFRIGKFKLVPQISYQRAISYNLETSTNNVLNDGVIANPGDQLYYDFQGYSTDTEKFSGGIDTVTLSLGTKLFKRFNIGISANFWVNGFTGSNSQAMAGNITPVQAAAEPGQGLISRTGTISVDVRGMTLNFGILVDVLENLKIGAVYKSSSTATVDYEGSHRIDMNVDGVPSTTGDELYSDSTEMRWPETWGFGISYRPIDTLTFSLDYTSTDWSQTVIRDFEHPYFGRYEVVYFPSFIPGYYQFGSIVIEGKQLDTRQLRFGVEYVLISKQILFPLRLGFFTDSQYFPDASGEKITFFGLTAGLGIKVGAISIDGALVYESGNYLRYNEDFSVTRYADFKFYMSAIYSF